MFVIHPYFTGRDKGPLRERNPNFLTDGGPTHFDILKFETADAAWEHIFTKVQPNDPRAKHNYRVYDIDAEETAA